MNFTNSSSSMKDAASCRVAKERYFLEYILATLPVIALNLGSCPIIILMNALVIIAIKARRRLQSIYNILLACLAGADMAVGLVSQPLFIAQEIFFLSGASVEDYCHFYRKTVFLCLFTSIESLLILALLSMERYIAMKFSLRYASLMTTPRLTGAVLCSWIISVFFCNFKLNTGNTFTCQSVRLCNCYPSHFNHCILSYDSLSCFTPAYKSDQNRAASKRSED